MGHALKRILDRHYRHYAQTMAACLKPYLDGTDPILDVGSGNGYPSRAIGLAVHCQLTGMDVIDVSQVGPRPIIYNGRDFPFADGSFSAAVCICVLHHVHEQEAVIAEMARVTTGTILIVEDVALDPFDRILSIWHRFVSGIKYRSRYIHHRPDREWKELFSRQGLSIAHEQLLSRWIDWTHPASKKLYILQRK